MLGANQNPADTASHWVETLTSELTNDAALRLYGGAVALLNGITAVYWLHVHHIGAVLSSKAEAICWPLFDGCQEWRVLSTTGVVWMVAGLGLMAVVNALMFLDQARVKMACVTLGVLTVLKLAILLSDYRLMANQHYMATWVSATYLLVPNRRRFLPFLIVLFYVWAGFLKLNVDWLSGAALRGARPFDMPVAWVPAACLYLVVLESCLAWGLLSRRPAVFWAVFGQFLVFHASSFWVVGYFYPIVMYLILTIFPLLRFRPAVKPITRTSVAGYAMIAVFCGLQLIPRAMSNDPGMTGEGRMFALSMYDGPISCIPEIRSHDNHADVSRMGVPFLQPSLACDPIVYVQAAKTLCRRREAMGRSDIDLVLRSKRPSAQDFSTVMDLEAVCSTPPRYSIVRHNAWIHSPGPS